MAYVKLEDAITKVDSLRCECDSHFYHEALTDVKSELLAMSTVNVAKVTYGKWYLHPDGSGTCDQCGRHQKSVWDMDNYQSYCGHCGADMRGENNEERT